MIKQNISAQKKLLIISLLVCCLILIDQSPSFAQDNIEPLSICQSGDYLNGPWRYQIDNNAGEVSLENIEGWSPITYNHLNQGTGPISDIEAEETYIYFAKEFKVCSNFNEDQIVLDIGKLSFVIQVYINGTLIGDNGRMPPDFFVFPSYYVHLPIHHTLLNKGEEQTNILLIKAYSDAGYFWFNGFHFKSLEDYESDHYWYTFLNHDASMIGATILLIFGLFYLILFLRQRDDKSYLYYGLASLFFALYICSLYLKDFFLGYIAFENICRGAVFMASAFYVVFLSYFYDILNNKLFHRIYLITGSILYLLHLIIPNNTSTEVLLFNLFMPFSLLSILITTFIVIVAIRRKKKNAYVILFGLMMVFITSFHDAYYNNFMESYPVVWLQIYGMITFYFTMMIALIGSFIQAFQDVTRFSLGIQQREKRLEKMLDQIKTTSSEINHISITLDESVDTTYEAMQSMMGSNLEIVNKIEQQSSIVEDTYRIVFQNLDDANTMSNNLLSQIQFLDKTSSYLSQIASQIQNVIDTTQTTEELSREMVELVKSGKEIVFDGLKGVQELEKYSDLLGNFVKIISDVSDRINLLAMNASIESAHAGELGKGFGIVAQEVRKLANDTRTNAVQVTEHLKQMDLQIHHSVNKSKQASQTFDDIEQRINNTANLVHQIWEQTQEERKSAQQLQDFIASLLKTIQSIKEQNEKLVSDRQNIGTVLNNLLESTKQMETEIKENTRESKDIFLSIEKTSSIVQENAKILKQLEGQLIE